MIIGLLEPNGKHILININHVIEIKERDNQTEIYLSNGTYTYVKQTVLEIYKIIKNKRINDA